MCEFACVQVRSNVCMCVYIEQVGVGRPKMGAGVTGLKRSA